MPLRAGTRPAGGGESSTSGQPRVTAGIRDRGRTAAQRLVPEGIARRVAQNTSWLIGERVVRLVGALAVTIWLVRYLGPADFGILSYAISVSMIAEVIAGLGVSVILVRELVDSPQDEAELIGSTAALRFVAGLLVGGGTLGLIWLIDGDPRAVAAVAIVISVVPLRALGAIEQSFQARMQSRLSVTGRMSAFAIASLVKIILLLVEAPLLAFAAAVALEAVVATVAFVVLYARSGHSPFGLRVRWERARGLLRESWPLALAGAAAMISLRIDQVMLRQMASANELGTYAAAARLSEVWYFVPVALGTALFPALVGSRDDQATHDRRLQVALDISAWLAIVIALVVTVFGGLVIHIIYGAEFQDSAGVLRMQVWAGPFVFMGVISGRSLVARGLQRFEAWRYVIGAPLNVGLNLVLIPEYGGIGAATATLLSYVVIAYVLPVLYPRSRHTGWLMTRAIFLPLRLRSEYLGSRSTRES